MAEAHSAVAFSFAITHEGWDVNFDREVLHLVWQSGIRSWKKRLARFKNSIKNGVYPAPLQSLWGIVAIITGMNFSGQKTVANCVNRIVVHLPENTLGWQCAGCALLGVGTWLSITFSVRYTLKMLFMYKGWMYEQRGRGSRISWQTKLWLVMVKLFSAGSKPLLYSFQGSLPRLPLPAVQDTMKRYLRSVRPLLNDEDYSRMEKLAADFEKGIAKKLQWYLLLKSWWSTNYVSDWWEEYVYLRGRSPLMVNSNFYGIDAILMHPTHVQAARAASIIFCCLQYRRLIERQELEPILIQGLVPLCSWQYERVFNTTRVPGLETDRIVHYNDSNHIAVYHRGRYYKVIIYYKGRILKPCEIEVQIQQILDDDSIPAKGEEKLAALTASERSTWAETRKKFFFKGTNRQSLDAVEKAAFVVALDDVPYEYDEKDPSKMDNYGRILLHGKGYDRWFDKSFTLCIGTNGRIGFNAEHSWYDETGHTLGTPGFTPPAPIRLQWDLPAECLTTIENSCQLAQNLLNDVDLRILVHTAYGKGFMKDCRTSPDAFIQMALQLAYFRVEDRIKKFQKACQVHQMGYQDAMCGKGIDRHLFCLYVVSKYLEVDSPFLKEVLSEPWRLSTSQTPHGQTSRLDLKQYPKCISAGGGFGPVADDGYGVSYIIAGEDLLFFHITSKKSSPETNSNRFSQQIERALSDIKTLFLQWKDIQKQQKK
ncbi:Protein withered, carnitine O-palmitoyltransferase [Gryllus bimaculatus]|nr:Protein withered, carnitine O-palmitoyltransferase [Gryllus bimaculatus]